MLQIHSLPPSPLMWHKTFRSSSPFKKGERRIEDKIKFLCLFSSRIPQKSQRRPKVGKKRMHKKDEKEGVPQVYMFNKM